MGIREIEYYLAVICPDNHLTYHSENGRKEYVKYKQLAEQKGITRYKLLYIQCKEEGQSQN